jgi:hypothetical protein
VSANPVWREAILRGLEEPVRKTVDEEDDIEITPPPPIDPAKLAAVSEIGSLEEGIPLYQAITRNIELLEGREELARKAQRLEYLKLANGARRCEHIKIDGTGCGSPAINGNSYCYFHERLHKPAPELPAIEDQQSLQVAFLQLAKNVATGTLNPAQAKVMLQILQCAGKNLPLQEEVEV